MNEQEMRDIGIRLETRAAEMSLPIKFTSGKVIGDEFNASGHEWYFRLIGSTRLETIKKVARDLSIAVGLNGLRISETPGGIVITHTLAVTTEYRVLEEMTRQNPGPIMAFGFSSDGSPILADLSKPRACHIGIFAQTQSGKTNLSQVAISTLCAGSPPREVGVVILDHKSNVDFAAMVGKHVIRHADTLEGWVSAMRWIVRLMDERAKALHEFDRWQRIVVYCDEVAEVVRRGGEEMNSGFASIARLGAGLKIHLFVCTQRPSAEEVKAILKSQIKLRLVGKVGTPQEAALCSGKAGTGAEKISRVGHFIAVGGGQNGGDIDVFSPLMSIPRRPVREVIQEVSPVIESPMIESPVIETGDLAIAAMSARIAIILSSATSTLSDNEICRRCKFTNGSGELILRVAGRQFAPRFKAALNVATQAVVALQESVGSTV